MRNNPPVALSEITSLRNVTLRLTRRLRKYADLDLTPSQMSALSTLERHGNMRVGELARREQIGKSSVTRLVAALEALGHVHRDIDPEDGRSSHIGLSDQGAALLAESNKRANDYLARQVDALSPAERAVLLSALPVLERLIAHKP